MTRTQMMGQIPLFELPSSWVAPTSVPEIPPGRDIAVDLETRDGGLNRDAGPGWHIGDGHVAGVAVSWQDGSETRATYLPLRHPETDNLDPELVMDWLQNTIDRASLVVFHNAIYDLGWLLAEGVTCPAEKIEDTHALSVVLDENRLSYTLDACCRWQGVSGKDEDLLRKAAAHYGLDPKKDIWRLPGRHVGPYAEQDARATLHLRERLLPQLAEQELIPAYRLEMDLIPMLLQMRLRGMRVDESRTEQNALRIDGMVGEVLADLRHRTGSGRISMQTLLSPQHLMVLFDKEGLEYPRTPKTKMGSFKSDWMSASSHWLPRAVVRARKLNDLSNKFLRNYILGSLERGRIHAEAHPLRDDDSGTRSFRFSYSNPPLQQIPARDPELSPLIRECFLPERDELFLSADYSQQEPRIGVHMAAVGRVRGAQAAIDYYMKDPDADFHQMVADMTGLSRKEAKIINLGMFYGMGVKKLALSLGVSEERATEILEQYNERMPWLAEIFSLAESLAQRRGFIRMIDGCRAHFDLWEPAYGESGTALRQEAARARWPSVRLRRAYTRDAFNRLVQGSAARQTKKAMLLCWNEGIMPMLQMHDELDFSVGEERHVARVGELMRDAVELRVPMKVDLQLGRNWAEASKEWPKGTTPPSWQELMAA